MLDIKKIVNSTTTVKKALDKRNQDFPLKDIKKLNDKRLEIIKKVEGYKAEKNTVSKQIPILKKKNQDVSSIFKDMQELNVKIESLDSNLNSIDQQIKDLLLSIPNTPHKSVPKGDSDSDNAVKRTFMEPTKFDFTPLAHWDIGSSLSIFDVERASKISGSRFMVYKGLGAKLERSLINFLLDTHIKNGYCEVITPFIVNSHSMIGTGQLPKFSEDMYKVENSDFYLIPTAEVPVTNLHRNEFLKLDELPISYCCYSACFRAEAGSAGRDTRGLIRQHQFNKVELVKFSHPDESYKQLEKLTRDAERILKLLKLPYRVVTLCGGDLGFSSAKTYDIEVWMPSYNRYVEISSCSNFEDYQARRSNIKFKDSDGSNTLIHTLNGSGVAVGRLTASILENYQNADGSVTVPKALKKYMGCDLIK